MLLNEEGWWRLMLATAIGLAAAAIIAIIRDPKGPVTAGVLVGGAAYAIDYFTERKEAE